MHPSDKMISNENMHPTPDLVPSIWVSAHVATARRAHGELTGQQGEPGEGADGNGQAEDMRQEAGGSGEDHPGPQEIKLLLDRERPEVRDHSIEPARQPPVDVVRISPQRRLGRSGDLQEREGQGQDQVVEREDAHDPAHRELAHGIAETLLAFGDGAPATQEDAGDEETGEAEEQIDPDPAPVDSPREALRHPVMDHHEQHCERSQAVELGEMAPLGRGGGHRYGLSRPTSSGLEPESICLAGGPDRGRRSEPPQGAEG